MLKFPPITLTASTLFAITVISMIAGHICYYFYPDYSGLRIPDRILVPVFLISVGYNIGHPASKTLLWGSLLLLIIEVLIFNHLYINILGTIILVKYTLEPLANIIFKNKKTFWISHAILIALSLITNLFIEYGTIAYIMALAGWFNKNHKTIGSNIITPSNYFILTGIFYLVFTQITFNFSALQITVMGLGLSIVMYLLYHIKILLMNSIKHKPKYFIGKFCKFLGHKSLEIYVIHLLIFQSIVYYISM